MHDQVHTPHPAGLERTAAALRERGYRVTSQRLLIQRTLEDMGRHVSVEELREAAAGRLPNLSLPTVYAALETLEDAGMVRRVPGGRGRALRDARTAEHHHLVCRRCGAVEDLRTKVALEAAVSAAARQGFAPDGAEVVVHGLCSRCR